MLVMAALLFGVAAPHEARVEERSTYGRVPEEVAAPRQYGEKYCAAFQSDIFRGMDEEEFWADWQDMPMAWHNEFGLGVDPETGEVLSPDAPAHGEREIFGVEEALQLAEGIESDLGLIFTMEFVRSGSNHDPRCGSSARAAYARGCTIVVPGAEARHPFLARLALALTPQLGRYTQLNMYLTPPGGQGFSAHFDTMDVMIVQLSGAKHWWVHGMYMRNPLTSHVNRMDARFKVFDTSYTTLEIPLHKPGDTLYIPRGWIHQATASIRDQNASTSNTPNAAEGGNEPSTHHSLHITVTLPTESNSLYIILSRLLVSNLIPGISHNTAQFALTTLVDLSQMHDEHWTRETLPALLDDPEEAEEACEMLLEGLRELSVRLPDSKAKSLFARAVASASPAMLKYAVRMCFTAVHNVENWRIEELVNTTQPKLPCLPEKPVLGNPDDLYHFQNSDFITIEGGTAEFVFNSVPPGLW